MYYSPSEWSGIYNGADGMKNKLDATPVTAAAAGVKRVSRTGPII